MRAHGCFISFRDSPPRENSVFQPGARHTMQSGLHEFNAASRMTDSAHDSAKLGAYYVLSAEVNHGTSNVCSILIQLM